jgi:RNA polymerase sigma-70 factor (ECF subfamily)
LETNNADILLIKAFKNGNIEAFEKLFDRYHKKLYVFLYQLLHSKEDAEEIVQETFIKIWEKREEFIEGYPFDSFLFKIAKNAFLNLNRKKINHRVFTDHLTLLSKISEDTTDNYIIFKETRDIINSVIDGLPPKRKEIFLLRQTQELSRKEIAKKLGISIVTVDSQLLKANKYLKEELKKYGLLLILIIIY